MKQTLRLILAILTLIVVGLGLLVWLQQTPRPWDTYDIFPVLGLTAFGLMWLHYISGSLKRLMGLAGDESVLRGYFNVTSVIVLALILLHPGLLVWQLFLDGMGPPPMSYLEIYPQATARIALLLGSIALIAFLLFELRHKFSDKPWWKYIEYLSIMAMGFIFIHALILGGELMSQWFRFVWVAYGVLFVSALVYNRIYDRSRRINGQTSSK